MAREASDITRLLLRYQNGEVAWDEVYEATREELHQLATGLMRQQPADHTLQPTALLHEAWLRLARQEDLGFQARSQFYGLASRAMRSVLVDHARGKQREKRGGGRERMTLETWIEGEAGAPGDNAPSVDLLDLEDALVRLEDLEPQLARVVELRFFGGLSHPEIAEVLGSSLRTVERSWRTARAWLQVQLSL